jgi:hypothetical protein
MSTNRVSSVLPILLAVVGAVGCADKDPVRANAADGSTPAARIVDSGVEPVSFTLEAGTCGLTTDVSGTGGLHFVFRVTETGNGQFRVGFNSAAHGTATGADGSRYVFNYKLNARYIDVTSTEAPYVINAVDDFHLLGQGAASDVHVFFQYSLQVNPDNSATFLSFRARGDPACDVI